MQAAQRGLGAEPTERGGLYDEAVDRVCRQLGIAQPERFVFTSGCTAALSLALSDLPWEEGDGLITSSLEHHALLRPVQRLSMQRGVVHHATPYQPGVPLDLDFVRDTLHRGGVRLVAVTHASNVTGELLPVRELCQLAHEYGALVLLDAAQSVGVYPLDVADLGVDILVFAGHKGALGPQGVGGLWASPSVGFDAGHAVCDLGGTPGASHPMPGFCDVGSVNLAGALGVAAGLGVRARERTVGERPRALCRELCAWLSEREDCTVFGGASAERTAALSFALDTVPLSRCEARFAEHGVLVRAGTHCAPQALEAVGAVDGTLRVSFGADHGAADLERLQAVIRQLLDRQAQ